MELTVYLPAVIVEALLEDSVSSGQCINTVVNETLAIGLGVDLPEDEEERDFVEVDVLGGIIED